MPTAEQNVVRLQRLIALATIALVGSTWRLWTPQTEFPQIPWFGWARHIPGCIDWTALVLLSASCLVLLLSGATSPLRRRGSWLFIASLVVLLLPSQHRLQPWAYQFLLLSLIFALGPPAHSLQLARWLVAGIYVHSALSKVDAAYFDAQGEALLTGLLDAMHLSDDFWTDGARSFAIGLFPAGELVVGIGLLVPSVRRHALVGSYAMHLLLLLTLGPLGLDHKPGVLIWNACFLAQNWLLYRPVVEPEHSVVNALDAASAVDRNWRSRMATVVTAGALFCPFLQGAGWYDVWPSWAVYSARPSLVTLHVREDRVTDLPTGLQEFVGPSQPLTDWRPVNIDAWSFATLNCPVYPQERFRIAVIQALAGEADLENDIQASVHGPPDRWTGRRNTIEVVGAGSLQERAATYRLNTSPRK